MPDLPSPNSVSGYGKSLEHSQLQNLTEYFTVIVAEVPSRAFYIVTIARLVRKNLRLTEDASRSCGSALLGMGALDETKDHFRSNGSANVRLFENEDQQMSPATTRNDWLSP